MRMRRSALRKELLEIEVLATTVVRLRLEIIARKIVRARWEDSAVTRDCMLACIRSVIEGLCSLY